MDVLGRSIFLSVVAVTLVTADDDWSFVRVQEKALARALKAKDQAVLSTLTDKDFRVSWTEGSVERTITTEEHREDWIDDLLHLRMDSYKVTILDVTLMKMKGTEAVGAAVVTLDESWIIHSPRGRRVEKRFFTTDFWSKLQGAWKLTRRDCRSSPH